MMMNAKHTLGPWEYVAMLSASENHKGFFIRAEKITRNGKWVLAEVKPGDEDGKLGKANASLIASAPELLAALETIVKSLADHDDEGMIEHAEQMVSARAAIAKAKGA